MASVAVAHHRNQYRNRKKINCRTFHSLSSNSPPKSSRVPKRNPKDLTFSDDFSCSELWAGPAYTNSPPPSSLPIPKFSLREKRSVSLELPPVESQLLICPGAKSAPVSPKSSSADFFVSAASATENLRRILNLDVDNKGVASVIVARLLSNSILSSSVAIRDVQLRILSIQ